MSLPPPKFIDPTEFFHPNEFLAKIKMTEMRHLQIW